ncbi:hypothetical protein [Clostridium felsineum]|uniref:Uncharacterized protein n=1 Tax=Clostridium felsineum TaxID=36839 RepID=A0A1S8L4J1_9CLOT|nr:hypothetical protein [Clostridium felsineum]URZ06798.1 hypothetical protein CLROS_021310 [Clostridium felsineum]URZ11830.1 hypothetical protein CROST_025470 [Clostridium felsineum]
MYIKYRKREKKNSKLTSFYFYNCKSYRDDKEKNVKTKQEYLLKFDADDLRSRNYINYETMNDLRKKDIKTWIRLVSKIEFDILYDENCTYI